jgi:hypothetical protein
MPVSLLQARLSGPAIKKNNPIIRASSGPAVSQIRDCLLP